mmetsp:Transcript_16599/g.34247  ORF Transcript_16599/g.34247 Transcript_16599/m.34247 type:complete len:178 (-) Transcript_16599:1423-1956(-)
MKRLHQWPSDHLAIGATFSFRNQGTSNGKEAEPAKVNDESRSDHSNKSTSAGDPPSKDEPVGSQIENTVTGDGNAEKTDPPAILEEQQILSGVPPIPSNDMSELFCMPLGGAAPPPPITNPQANEPQFPSQQHGQRCDCGCVPAVPSLFEMAEQRKLRKQRREQKQRELAAAAAAEN